MASIAIVIAVYNGASTLQKTLDSIKAQSVAPDQLIVMDGGSTDGTLEILARNAAQLTHWESAPDKGIYDAWNKALPHVTSDWLWFIGCDDWLADSDVIRRWHLHLDEQPPQVGLVYGKVSMVTSAGKVAEVIGEPWPKAKRKMGYYMNLPHTGMLSRMSLFGQIGPFSTDYAIAGDYEWTLRALDRCAIRHVNDMVIYMSDAGLSGSTRTVLRITREFRDVARKRGRLPIGWYWLYAKGLTKHGIRSLLGPSFLRYVTDGYRLLTFRKPRLSSR